MTTATQATSKIDTSAWPTSPQGEKSIEDAGTLTVGRRTFRVERIVRAGKPDTYLLHGVRGATYGLMYNQKRQDLYFAYSHKGNPQGPFPGMWFRRLEDGTVVVH